MASYKYKMCLCFTRKFRLTEAEPPSDVKEAFATFAEGGTHMSADQLRRFLIERQGSKEDEAAVEAERVVEHYWSVRHRIHVPRKHTILLEDFHHYLFNDELNPPIRSQLHDDMTATFSHYYVYTGHNSYLTGNQLSSDCSDAPITRALERGVRVIELDMWPNSTKDNIDILHGRTLTSPVELIKCLRAIKESAFSSSPYNVVITLEDHLTPDLQAKAAKMITETFGDLLFYPDSHTMKEFPSPQSLMKRIIISTKPPKEYLDSKILKDKEEDPSEPKGEPDEEAWGKEVPDLKSEIDYDDKDNDEDEKDDDEDDDDDDDEDDEQKPHQEPAPEYKRIITITAGKPKGGLKEALKIDPNKVRRLSLSEQELVKASASYGTDIVRFTQKNILRVYPKGTRFNSSNYNPFVGWMHGAQMVAFNMQGYGRSLWLMQGFFRANGGCGYVKKPDLLMQVDSNNKVFDPQETRPVKKTLKVKVYMGDGWRFDFKKTHFDAYSPPDFYTRVGIAGVPADVVMRKTKAIEDNWTPVWNEEFSFPLTVPEIAVLRVEVHEYDISEKDDFAGQTCLPVCELRPGIRAVPLFDRKGIKFTSVKLLMSFEFC